MPTEQVGRRLVVSREVSADVETVWEILTDTRQWPAWGPSVTDVECPDRHVAGGTTGRVRLPGGVWLPFEVTACERDRWTWKVARVPATGHRVEPTDRGSRVGLDLPLYGVAYAPVCRRALREVDRLAGERDDGHRGRHPPED